MSEEMDVVTKICNTFLLCTAIIGMVILVINV